MTSSLTSLRTEDGLQLDVLRVEPSQARTQLLLWPCAGGACQAYRPPLEALREAGVRTWLFNPRGHGRSEGSFELPEALRDLRLLLGAEQEPALPLWLVGHSAGAAGCVKYAHTFAPQAKLVLLAPVLRSRRSAEFMHQQGHARELLQVFASYLREDSAVGPLLADGLWLDPAHWAAAQLRPRLDALSGPRPLGRLIEALFHPGHACEPELQALAARARIWLPEHDTWYPQDEVLRFAAQNGVPTERVPGALDHFFTGAWPQLWHRLLAAMAEDLSA